jgi:hypothetical protein
MQSIFFAAPWIASLSLAMTWNLRLHRVGNIGQMVAARLRRRNAFP